MIREIRQLYMRAAESLGKELRVEAHTGVRMLSI